MIRIQDCSYRYPETDEHALRDINLHIPAGQFCGIVGPNEAGKSTLCYAITGFIPHYYKGSLTGQIIVAGRDITTQSLNVLTGEVGLVFQNPFNQITGARFTVREEIAFGLENMGMLQPEMVIRVAWAMELMGLDELAERSPFELSGGQQQRLAIASMIAMRPKILVLDEPSSQLDPAGTKDLFLALQRMINADELTVVMVEHKLEWLASFADRLILLAEGKVILDGTPQEVLASPLMEKCGVKQTRYTKAASLAKERGQIQPERPLPVTLKEAIETFR